MAFGEIMTRIDAPEPLPVPSYGEMVGTPIWVGIGTAEVGGEEQVVPVQVIWHPDGEYFTTVAFQAPPEVYAGWGGIGQILLTLGLVGSDIWDDQDLAELATLDVPHQRTFFAEAAETQWSGLMQQAMGTLLMQQQSTLGTMQQMNDNLQAETGCIVAGNCSMDYDGLGNAAPSYE